MNNEKRLFNNVAKLKSLYAKTDAAEIALIQKWKDCTVDERKTLLRELYLDLSIYTDESDGNNLVYALRERFLLD